MVGTGRLGNLPPIHYVGTGRTRRDARSPLVGTHKVTDGRVTRRGLRYLHSWSARGALGEVRGPLCRVVNLGVGRLLIGGRIFLLLIGAWPFVSMNLLLF